MTTKAESILVRFRVRVTAVVKFNEERNNVVVKAIAELRRTLEREGYQPEIDFVGVVP